MPKEYQKITLDDRTLMQTQLRQGFKPGAVAAILVVGSAWPAAAALASEYPERQITAIVPYAAGSTTDTMARLICPPLAKALGQQVIIVNRAGADGRIGAEALAKAAADGHTIAFSGAAQSHARCA